MPIPTRSIASSEPDTYSLLSQATTTMTIGDSLPAQLVRMSARKGFTFNIMSVGPPGLGKTTLLSSLFGRNLEIVREKNPETSPGKIQLNPAISIESKTFEIDERRVKLKLTVVECKNYGESLSLKDTHIPLVDYIDSQFADYHKRESSFDRRNIQDKMIHCLFFFISPIGHGLSQLDLEFLKAVHGRVNIVPIIARAEALTLAERASFKRRVKDDFEKNNIQVYQIPEADPDDADDVKKLIKEMQEAMPFAISSMTLRSDNTLSERCLDWGRIDTYDKAHSDFSHLKTMLNMQMSELCHNTHQIFYEDYRLRMMPGGGDLPRRPLVKNMQPSAGY